SSLPPPRLPGVDTAPIPAPVQPPLVRSVVQSFLLLGRARRLTSPPRPHRQGSHPLIQTRKIWCRWRRNHKNKSLYHAVSSVVGWITNGRSTRCLSSTLSGIALMSSSSRGT